MSYSQLVQKSQGLSGLVVGRGEFWRPASANPPPEMQGVGITYKMIPAQGIWDSNNHPSPTPDDPTSVELLHLGARVHMNSHVLIFHLRIALRPKFQGGDGTYKILEIRVEGVEAKAYCAEAEEKYLGQRPAARRPHGDCDAKEREYKMRRAIYAPK
ncbi:hypothetical protein BD779DRAFT_1472648 [Infundibulicybe gibba]|nr:hypothetical protein BD779DRAFT_1478533 [Infundibulicybe gibba]KAF8883148.1 hypothetical protein BD779DRAFT_1472648 [Infundibulicybe gibba]